MQNTSVISDNSETKAINISLFEWILIIFFIFSCCYWGYRFAPGAIYWDDLLYIHTSWSMEPLPIILNRYFTIYLLNIFNSIAGGDPILGGQYFGVFTTSIILVLVYLNPSIYLSLDE
jgi:hypothetical protein